MKAWDAARVAAGAGATLLVRPGEERPDGGPSCAVIDSRRVG
ncbi:MAG: hypothetical protein QOF54_1183, partial [Solirubrobacteraceae bacterium]|nr:hypothetical protein [Solirubrobacteraceae bacterium]